MLDWSFNSLYEHVCVTVLLCDLPACVTFQGLTAAFRNPEDPEILLLSGAAWRDELVKLVVFPRAGETENCCCV